MDLFIGDIRKLELIFISLLNIIIFVIFEFSFQIFGGFFAAKIGTKLTLALSLTISSLTTLLIPFAADSFGNYRLLIILRVFTGLAQGLIYPAALPFITIWSTKSEKSILWSIITSGSCLGIILSTIISGPVCSTGYWELNFIVSGTLILF